MKKKIFSVFLVLCIVLTMLPIAEISAFAETNGDFAYRILSEVDKTCEITGYTGSETELNIPSVLDGYTVTSIGNNTFSECQTLTSVTISDSVINIGWGAFYGCTALTSVTLPDSVAYIGVGAFHNCTSLASITIPDSMMEIDENAFWGCTALTSIKIPGSVTRIMDRTFYDCTALTNVIILDGVTHIYEHAFDGCTALTSVTIPDSVTYIGDSAFAYCTALTSITIPDGVTEIGNDAFDCTALRSITIPDSVTEIGDNAFCHTPYYSNKSNWKNDVLYIGKHLIGARDSIGGAYTIESGTITIAGGVFSHNSALTSITIPNSVKGISTSAFYDCTSLESITIPDSVTHIGDNAFYNTVYYNNESNWENDVLYIGNHLIEAKDTITGSYTVRTGTKTVAEYAFGEGCTSLTSITIPESVISIGNDNFVTCNYGYCVQILGWLGSYAEKWTYSQLQKGKQIEFIPLNTTYTWTNGQPGDFNSSATVALLDKTNQRTDITLINNCEAENWWENIKNVFALSLRDETGAKWQPNKTLSVTLKISPHMWFVDTDEPLYVYRVENDGTFTDMSALQYPNGYGYSLTFQTDFLGKFVVSDAKPEEPVQLTYNVLEDNTIEITGSRKDLSLHPHLIIPAVYDGYTVSAVGNSAFQGHTEITALTVEDGVKIIGNFAFAYCSNLSEIHLPDSIEDIENMTPDMSPSGAFYETTYIKDPENYAEDGNLYYGNIANTASADANGAITYREGTVTIGSDAWCPSAKSVYIPQSVQHIGKCVWFASYDETTEVYIDATIYGYVGSYAETWAKEHEYPFVAVIGRDTTSGVMITETDNNNISVPNGTKLSVRITDTAEEQTTYEISMLQNGNPIQPTAPVTVKIPVPATMVSASCKVYRQEADGTYTDMNAKYENGYMVFTTDHFSIYVLTTESLGVTLGDINRDGTLDDWDSVLLDRYLAGWDVEINASAADMDKNGIVDDWDGILLARKLAGWN